MHTSESNRDFHECEARVEISIIHEYVLLCARGVRQIFSDSYLYHNDSNRVREKVFQNEAEPSIEKSFWTSNIVNERFQSVK